MRRENKNLNLSIEKAHEIQLQLSKHIVHEDVLPKNIRYVAGVDVAYVKNVSVGAVTVLDYVSLEILESKTTICKTRFPYIPTLLSFREILPTVSSIKRLKLQPDVFLVDAHGFAHPYKCGFASHLGLAIGKPTIGVAKSRLFGRIEEEKRRKGCALLTHNNEVIGAAFAKNPRYRPIFISVGHKISLETAIEIVKHCTIHDRIPKPIADAHELATSEKQKISIT